MKKKKRTRDNSKTLRTLGYGALGGVIANTAIVSPMIPNLNKTVAPTAEIKRSLKAFMHKNKISDIPIYLGADAKHAGGFDSSKKSPTFGIHTRNASNEAIILHEAGHAKNWKPVIGKKLHDPVAIIRGLSVFGGTAAGGAHYLANKDSKLAPAYPLLYSSPTLVDEGLASARATGHLLKRYGFKKGMSKSKSLLPAFLTYLALPGVMSGAIYYDQKQRKVR